MESMRNIYGSNLAIFRPMIGAIFFLSALIVMLLAKKILFCGFQIIKKYVSQTDLIFIIKLNQAKILLH